MKRVLVIVAAGAFIMTALLTLRWGFIVVFDRPDVVFHYLNAGSRTDSEYDRLNRGRVDLNASMPLRKVKGGGSARTYLCSFPAEIPSSAWSNEILLKDRNWQKIWIQFVPEESGRIDLLLRGGVYEDLSTNKHEVYVDSVSMEPDDQIYYGEFEQIADLNIELTAWGACGDNDVLGENVIIRNKHLAHDGEYMACVWHDVPIKQELEVEKETRYTITAYFRKK